MALRPQAETDLREIAEWYENLLPGLGVEFLHAVDTRLESVAEGAEQFPVVRGRIRRAIVLHFPYGIFFTIADQRVHVLACMHHRRHPRRWRSRGPDV